MINSRPCILLQGPGFQVNNVILPLNNLPEEFVEVTGLELFRLHLVYVNQDSVLVLLDDRVASL